jgi:hypothetical protein
MLQFYSVKVIFSHRSVCFNKLLAANTGSFVVFLALCL